LTTNYANHALAGYAVAHYSNYGNPLERISEILLIGVNWRFVSGLASYGRQKKCRD